MSLFTVTIPAPTAPFTTKTAELQYIRNVLAACVQQFTVDRPTGNIVGLRGITNGGAGRDVGTWTYTTTL